MHSPISGRTSLLIALSSIFFSACGHIATVSAIPTARAVTANALAVANADGKVTKTAIVTVNPQVRRAYFGQTLPGEIPVLFAPEKLNALSPWVEHTDFSPDGTLFFASVGTADYSDAKLYSSTLVNDEWTPFVEPPFLSDFTYSNEPVFSADGATLTFTGKKATGSLDLWTVSYANQRWGRPVGLPPPINSDAKEFRGSSMSNGTFYFGSQRSGMMQV